MTTARGFSHCMAGLAFFKLTVACMLMIGCGVKVDLQLESGEYFLAQEARAERTKETQQQRQAERVAERKRKREAAFEPPAQVNMLYLELGDVHALSQSCLAKSLDAYICSRKQYWTTDLIRQAAPGMGCPVPHLPMASSAMELSDARLCNCRILCLRLAAQQ